MHSRKKKKRNLKYKKSENELIISHLQENLSNNIINRVKYFKELLKLLNKKLITKDEFINSSYFDERSKPEHIIINIEDDTIPPGMVIKKQYNHHIKKLKNKKRRNQKDFRVEPEKEKYNKKQIMPQVPQVPQVPQLQQLHQVPQYPENHVQQVRPLQYPVQQHVQYQYPVQQQVGTSLDFIKSHRKSWIRKKVDEMVLNDNDTSAIITSVVSSVIL